MDILWDVDDWVIRDKLFSYIEKDFSGKLLDVPTGTGLFTQDKYLKMESAEIIALDYSEDMLTQAQERFFGMNNVTCVQGDVGNLSFANAEFDVVLSMNGFHAFPDKEAAFSETARVLKPGGVFLATFYIKKERRLTDWMVSLVLSKRGWFTPPFWTRSELLKILEKYYSQIKIDTINSMVILKCTK